MRFNKVLIHFFRKGSHCQKLMLLTIMALIIFAPKMLLAEEQPLINESSKNEDPIVKEKIVKKKAVKKKSPTTIRSEIINVKRRSGIIEFLENVTVENEDTRFLADKMWVYYDDVKSANSNPTANGSNALSAPKSTSIKKIDAKDNVKIFNEEFIATGDIGFYDPNSGSAIIEQNVVLNRGTSVARGQKFVYDLNTKKGYMVNKKGSPQEGVESLEDGRVMVIIGNDIKDDQNEEEGTEVKDKKNQGKNNSQQKAVKTIETQSKN